MNSERQVIVVGAGIVGVCCALALVRDGAAVTLIDKAAPGEQASFGHAGVFGIPYCLPAATPAALRHLPQMILDRDHAFVLRARAGPRLLPWFVQFARASRHTAGNTAAADALQRDIRADWDDVLQKVQAAIPVRWFGSRPRRTDEASALRASSLRTLNEVLKAIDNGAPRQRIPLVERPNLVRLSVAEIMSRWPATIRVFVELRLHCVGCPIGIFHTLSDAAREHSLDVEGLAQRVEAAIADRTGPRRSRRADADPSRAAFAARPRRYRRPPRR